MAIGTVLSLIGLGAEVGLQLYGISEQRQAAEEDYQKSEKIRKQSLAQAAEDRRYARKERAKEWRWREDDKEYQRAQNYMSGFNNMLNQNDAYKNKLVNIWGKK